MRIGLMGGTFDPPHLAHVIPTTHVVTEFRLDRVHFVPNYMPPHKERIYLTDSYHRAAMVAIALEKYDEFILDPIELRKQKASYTVDTIEEMIAAHPEDQLFFIMGSDSFVELETWHDYKRLLQLCEFIIINRGTEDDELQESLQKLETLTQLNLRDRIHFAHAPYLPISSTEIRNAISAGTSVSKWVSPEVQAYIEKHHLYKRR
jgi:nicotinate-nucleotide adenylyltransferase